MPKPTWTATERARERIMDRLASKFLVGDECWEWTASKDPRGYGRFSIEGVPQLAHRVIYIIMVGPIPQGLELDHLCRNTSCVKPSHLEPVTHAENLRRGQGGEHHRVKTHCPQGHPYEGDNLYINPIHGGRYCKTCRSAASVKYRAKQKARA